MLNWLGVQHITSTHRTHLYSTQNLSVQHQKPFSSTHSSVQHPKPFKCVDLRCVLNWRVSGIELTVVLNWGFFVLNWRILGAGKEWPFCVELRGCETGGTFERGVDFQVRPHAARESSGSGRRSPNALLWFITFRLNWNRLNVKNIR